VPGCQTIFSCFCRFRANFFVSGQALCSALLFPTLLPAGDVDAQDHIAEALLQPGIGGDVVDVLGPAGVPAVPAVGKPRRSALIGAGLGALIMAVVSVPYNYFIVYPAYVVLYHLPLEAIIGMYQAINPSVDGLLTCLITFNFPFTLFKGLLDAALCFLIYKPLSGVLHGRK